MNSTFTPEIEAEVRESVWSAMDRGFSPVEWIADDVAELIADENEDVDEDAVRARALALIDELEGERRVLEATWPAVTDNDRLDRAFASLNANGIVALQNFSCCGTCAWSEIGEPIEQAQSEGKAVEGCVFYHSQGTDCAHEFGHFHLYYGTSDETADDLATKAIGERVVQALQNEGLTVSWNGEPGESIVVQDFAWRKRWKRHENEIEA